MKGEVVATLGTVSDTNYWANAVDATVARNISPEKSLALLMVNAAPPEITGAILHPWQPDPHISIMKKSSVYTGQITCPYTHMHYVRCSKWFDQSTPKP